MRFRIIAPVLLVTLMAASSSIAGDTPDQKRDKSRKMAAQTLKDLYKLQPTSKAAIQKSAGYAVFNNMGAHLLLLSTARGAGIAVNSKTKHENLHENDLCWCWSGLGCEGLSGDLRI